MQRILIGTKNPGKIVEYKTILKKHPLKVITLRDLNIEQEVIEDQKTFKQNAIKKAKFYFNLSKLPTLAEDGGIEIDYLNGEPGIKSRRWPGYQATDEQLISITLEKLNKVPFKKRTAQLRVVIALIIDGKINTAEGALRGLILKKPVKKIISGYPFRSLFYIPEANKTLAGMSEKEEMLVSHRKKALQKLLLQVKNI